MPDLWRLLSNCHNELEAASVIEAHPEILSLQDARGGSILHYLCSTHDKQIIIKYVIDLNRVDVNQLDDISQTCLDKCVNPLAIHLLVPWFSQKLIDHAILSAIAMDRDTVVEVLIKEININNSSKSATSLKSASSIDSSHSFYKYFKHAVERNSVKCVVYLLNHLTTDEVERTWLSLNSQKITEIFMNHHIDLSQEVFDQLVHPQVILSLLTWSKTKAYEHLLINAKTMQILIEGAPFEEINLIKHKLPSATEDNVATAAAQDNIDLLHMFLGDRKDSTRPISHNDLCSSDISFQTLDLNEKLKIVAIQSSIIHGAIECVRWLFPKVDSSRLPLVMLACSYCHADVINELLRFGCDAAVKDAKGRTALHELSQVTGEAIGQSRPPPDYESILMLLSQLLKTSVNVAENTRGDTALHIAVRESNWLAAHYMLNVGADPNMTNFDNETPIDIAVKQESIARLQILLQNRDD